MFAGADFPFSRRPAHFGGPPAFPPTTGACIKMFSPRRCAAMTNRSNACHSGGIFLLKSTGPSLSSACQYTGINVQRSPISRSLSRSTNFELPHSPPPLPSQLPVCPKYGDSKPAKPPPKLNSVFVGGGIGFPAIGYVLGTLPRNISSKRIPATNMAPPPARKQTQQRTALP